MTKLAIYREDDLYLIEREGVYYVHGTVDGRRIRKSCDTRDLARAKLFLENLNREATSGWREDYDRADRDWKTVAEMMHGRQKHAATHRGIPFDLKAGEVYALMRATAFRCAVSGVAFAKRFASDGKRDPWAPSIDRIENRQGYSVENVRIVCMAANIAMADWGFDVLLRLSRGIHRSSLTLSDELSSNRHADAQDADKPLMHIVKND